MNSRTLFLAVDPSGAARQLPLQGSLWRVRIWALWKPSFLAAVSRLPASGRARPPALGTRRGKVLARRTYSAPTSPVRCRHIAAGEDGHHVGRARHLARPPNAGRILDQQPHRIATGRAAALRSFIFHIGARVTTRKFRRQTEADAFRPPPKIVFPFGESEGRFLLSPQKKAPLRKNVIKAKSLI